MNKIHLSLLSFFILLSSIGFAQQKSETIHVAGECGTCKKKIEKAAKSAGATYALWDADTKELSVKYKASASSTEKIEKAVAKVGYDTEHFKADDAVYDNLADCCKYERTTAKTQCCDMESCSGSCGMKKTSTEKSCCVDGKCTHDDKKSGASCCKKS